MRALRAMLVLHMLIVYSATSLKSSSTRSSTLPTLLVLSLRTLCALVARSRITPMTLLLQLL